MKLTVENLTSLIAKAFVLEALTEKPGCTSRSQDLPHKSLYDFVIVGINSASYIARAAVENQANGHVFRGNIAALEASNVHKDRKFINLGLLEIMFLAVAARLECDDPATIINSVVEKIRRTNENDVAELLQTRKVAWTTSSKPQKQTFDFEKYEKCKSVGEFYDALYEDFPPGDSRHEWALQCKSGLPILQAFFDAYQSSKDIMATTTTVYCEQREKFPETAIGILADMCAAALFLHLSYQ